MKHIKSRNEHDQACAVRSSSANFVLLIPSSTSELFHHWIGLHPKLKLADWIVGMLGCD